MPVKSWDTKADFDGAYRIRVVDPVTGVRGAAAHYERRVMYRSVEQEYDRLIALFGWPTSSTIAVVGCGFGWSLEVLQSRGYAEVYGADTSAYIQAAKTELDPADGIARALLPDRILDETLVNQGSRNRFVNATIGQGQQYDVAIVERVVTSLTDVESVNLTNAARQVAKSVAQLIVLETALVQDPGVGQDPGYNWKSLADWRALLPTEWTIVESGGHEVL